MPTPEDYALAAASSANDALLSALLASSKAVLTTEDEVAAAQWAADAYTYMLNSQGNITYVTFDGNINAGTSSVPVGKVQLRRDLAGSWTVANPILGLGELGIETDTRFIKIGDGSTHWVDLPYMGSTKSAVGLSNVDNTSDINKPVSTAQALADTAILNAAKAYTDSSSLGHLIDVGEYEVSITNAYPTTGGTGTLGAILKGNVFTVIGSGIINTIAVKQHDTLRALVDNPTQDDADWLISINPETISKPYILILNIPGMVIQDYYYPSHIFTVPVSYTINFTSSIARSKIYATNEFVFTILKNGISVGTLTFAAGSVNGVFSSSVACSVIAGDLLEFKSQLESDPTLSNVTISLYGTRT